MVPVPSTDRPDAIPRMVFLVGVILPWKSDQSYVMHAVAWLSIPIWNESESNLVSVQCSRFELTREVVFCLPLKLSEFSGALVLTDLHVPFFGRVDAINPCPHVLHAEPSRVGEPNEVDVSKN